jgi:hypothetical protein
MHAALLLKIALWMTLIGAVAQLTPNPAWPSWLAQAVFWTGVGLTFVLLLRAAWRADQARKQGRNKSSR